jgi:hypothetical protein
MQGNPGPVNSFEKKYKILVGNFPTKGNITL